MSGEDSFFKRRKKIFAVNRRKAVVRRAAKFRVDSYHSLMVNLDEALRPPLLRVMQDTGHCILSLFKKSPRRTYIMITTGEIAIYLMRSL
jgi:hypothetical protein